MSKFYGMKFTQMHEYWYTSTQNIMLLSNKITNMTYVGNTILKSTFCKNFNFSIGICHSHSDSLVIWRYGSSSAVYWNTQSSKCNTIWSFLIGTTKPKKNSKKASDTACPLVNVTWYDPISFHFFHRCLVIMAVTGCLQKCIGLLTSSEVEMKLNLLLTSRTR